jgi:hypothetical protein
MGEENTKVKAEVLISHAEYSRMNGLCPDVNEAKYRPAAIDLQLSLGIVVYLEN